MSFISFVFAVVIALIFTAIFFYGFRNRGPWGTFWSFFLIMFLVVWSAAIWFTDIGPVWMDVAWAPIFFTGLILAIILASATPPDRPRRMDVQQNTPPGNTGSGALSVFFWITVIVLGIVIVMGLMTTELY